MEAICTVQRAMVGAGLKARFLCFKYLLAKKPMRTFKSVGHLLNGYKPGFKILDKDRWRSSKRVGGV